MRIKAFRPHFYYSLFDGFSLRGLVDVGQSKNKNKIANFPNVGIITMSSHCRHDFTYNIALLKKILEKSFWMSEKIK